MFKLDSIAMHCNGVTQHKSIIIFLQSDCCTKKLASLPKLGVINSNKDHMGEGQRATGYQF